MAKVFAGKVITAIYVGTTKICVIVANQLDKDNIEIIGLMGMAEYTSDETIISNEFQILNDLQKRIKEELHIDLKELSIGMSNDYKIALKHNATYLRLGSVLFKKEAN